MKIKSLLVAASLALLSLSSQVLGATDVIAVYTGDSDQLHYGSAWRNLETGNILSGLGITDWDTSGSDNNIIRFMSADAYAAQFEGQTMGSNTTVKFTMHTWYLGGVIVDEGATGYSVIQGSTGQSRHMTLVAGKDQTESIFQINENFSFTINSTTNSAGARNMNLGSVDSSMTVASGKTFQLAATLAGSSARTLTLDGGGTLDYNYNNGTSYATQANFTWDVTGAGTTLDLASVAAEQVTLALGSGSVKLSDTATLSVASGAVIDTQIDIAATGGTLQVAGDTAADVIVSNLRIEQGAGLSLGAGDTLSTSSMTLSSTDSSSAYTLTSANGTASITENTLTGLNLTGLDITVADGAHLTLSNVTIDTAPSITLGAGSSVSYDRSALTSLTVASAGTVDFTSFEGIEKTGVTAYTITGITDLLDGVTATGSLTLDLTGLAGFTEPADGELIAFILDGVTDLADIIDTGYYNNIIIKVGEYSSAAQGAVMYDGKVMVYIPEPSSASLTLLALAGLLGRRRRK